MSTPLRVVAIGGGTGLPVILRGLRNYLGAGLPGSERLDPDFISAIVSVTDDGGSSGRLVDEFDTLPPGDIRNCLLAMADEKVAPVIRNFLGYRFSGEEDGELAGHSVGNLVITALTRLNGNDFRQAILDVARILSLRGRILFPTLERVILCARLQDGTLVSGESHIARRRSAAHIEQVFLAERSSAQGDAPGPVPADVAAMEEAVAAVSEADVILLGPGSLYTSILPNLIVRPLAQAVATRGAKVPIFYICNIMTEPGETDGFSVGDHLRAIRRHADIPIHYCIVNRQRIGDATLQQYAHENLLRGYDTVRQALDEVVRAAESQEVGPDFLIEHAETQGRRLQRLSIVMSQAMKQQIQVLPSPSRDGDLGGTRLVEVDAVLEVEIPDRRRTKKVIRHDGVAVVREVLSRL